MKLTFQQWLSRQATRADRVGDLARDVARADLSGIPERRSAWWKRLECLRAGEASMVALQAAWAEFEMIARRGK